MTKTFITFLCICLIAFCYWLFNDQTIWWRMPDIKRGLIEKICMMISVIFIASFVIILWLN